MTELNKLCYDAVDVKMMNLVRIAVGLVFAAPLVALPRLNGADVLPPGKAAEAGAYEVKTTVFRELMSKSRPDRHLPVRVHFPSAQGSWPVVIFSHGGGGNMDSSYAQARHLASHGYMVCCVEHVGSSADRLKGKGKLWDSLRDMTRDREEVLGRPVDIKEVLDQVELWNGGLDELWGKFDLDHVAVVGHSFGAYTALVICGARPALNWLERSTVQALRPDKDFLKTRTGKGLGPSLSDPRVRVGIALSPPGPGEPFFLDESFASIDRPVLGISGSEDRQPGVDPAIRKKFIDLTPSAGTLLLWLQGADYTSFSDPTGSGQSAVPSASRESVQPLSRAATLYFLDAYLKGRKEGLALLKDKAFCSLAGPKVSQVEVMERRPAPVEKSAASAAGSATGVGSGSGAGAGPETKGAEPNQSESSKPFRLRDLLGGVRKRES